MSEWDPWKRYEREFWRRRDDPWYRYEYQKERERWDPFYRYERQRERMRLDPYYRMEKRMSDPLYQYDEKQRRLREDPWYRELYRREHGLLPYEAADPMYVIEKETGFGTRPNDYFNPEYRTYMDRYDDAGEKRVSGYDSGEFMQKFFDPSWATGDDIEKQLRELEEKRKREQEVLELRRRRGGILGFFRRFFGFP